MNQSEGTRAMAKSRQPGDPRVDVIGTIRADNTPEEHDAGRGPTYQVTCDSYYDHSGRGGLNDWFRSFPTFRQAMACARYHADNAGCDVTIRCDYLGL